MDETQKKMGGAKAIKVYFEQDGGRRVTMDELKALTHEERTELGKLACAELGFEYDPPRV